MQINLNDSTALYSTIIEESAMPIALYTGDDMVIKVANKAMLKAWDKDSGVIGQQLAVALPELKDQPFLKILNTVYHTGIAYEAKEDLVSLMVNGQLQDFYFDFIYKPIKDELGKVLGILNTATNVTELVNAKLNSNKNEELFRKLIKDAPVGIGVLEGVDLIIREANSELLKLWGKSEQIIGLKIIEGLPEIVDQPFPELLKQVYLTGIAHYGNETLAKIERDGITRNYYFNFVYNPIRNEQGNITGIMIVANEVTAQVEARIKVIESEDRFKNLLLEAPMATALYETQDIIIKLANAEMLKMWGKDESVIGKPMEEAIPELKEQAFISILKKVYETGTPYHAEQEAAELFIDGSLKKGYYTFTYKPLYNAEGHVYGILHAAMDVTKQVYLQQQKDEFLGIASHELKTPVTSIKAYAQVLEKMIRNDGDERKANMVQKMDIQLNRLTGLITDLLDVTKIQAGKMTTRPIIFDFDLAVLEVVEEMQHTTNKHVLEMDLNSHKQILYDKERIGQVVTNFISNAIKYSSDAKRVVIKSYVLNDEVVLSVQDYGIGISDEAKQFVFDQFYRVNGDLQHTYPGLGLGLYISAEIIKNAGGRFWLESEVGKGSTFYFALKI